MVTTDHMVTKTWPLTVVKWRQTMANDVYSSLLFRNGTGTVGPEKAYDSWKFCLFQWLRGHLVCGHWSRNRHPHLFTGMGSIPTGIVPTGTVPTSATPGHYSTMKDTSTCAHLNFWQTDERHKHFCACLRATERHFWTFVGTLLQIRLNFVF